MRLHVDANNYSPSWSASYGGDGGILWVAVEKGDLAAGERKRFGWADVKPGQGIGEPRSARAAEGGWVEIKPLILLSDKFLEEAGLCELFDEDHAVGKEYNALKDLGTLVGNPLAKEQLPPGANVITSELVKGLKIDVESGKCLKAKARWVCRGWTSVCRRAWKSDPLSAARRVYYSLYCGRLPRRTA